MGIPARRGWSGWSGWSGKNIKSVSMEFASTRATRGQWKVKVKGSTTTFQRKKKVVKGGIPDNGPWMG
jgi:hypothetical protein